jgi:hypothetical protein
MGEEVHCLPQSDCHPFTEFILSEAEGLRASAFWSLAMTATPMALVFYLCFWADDSA